VAVIGTGATAYRPSRPSPSPSGHLTVFQRNANWCAPLHNSKIDAETQREIKSAIRRCLGGAKETSPASCTTPIRAAFEVSDEEREAFFEKIVCRARLRYLAG